jgi:hypothetical protein
MEMGIEVLTDRLDPRHAATLEQLKQVLMNELDAPPIGFVIVGGRLGPKRTLEIVDEGKELGEHVGARRLEQLTALALGPFAKVVELRRLAQQQVPELVTLA